MSKDKEIDETLKDSKGNFFKLEPISDIYEDFNFSEFIPEDLNYPNAYYYIMISHNKETDSYEALHVDDLEEKEILVKRLKEIHGIIDPWDTDPEYFKKKLKNK